MKISFACFFLFVVLGVSAQTDSLVHISGTNFSMKPPKGFVQADRFTGFQQNSTGASIMVIELPGPYESIVVGLTPEGFKTQNMIMKSSEDLTFNGSPAKWLIATQSLNGIDFFKQMLVFKGGEKTILVNGIYPSQHKTKLDSVVKTAMLTTAYQNASNTITDEKTLFTIDVSGTAFKPTQAMSTSIIYTVDSENKATAPKFICSNSVSRVASENRKSYAVNRIMSLPRGDENVIKDTTEITIDGMSGYEIVAYGKDAEGNKQLVYEVIVYNIQGDYYMMIGMASEDFDAYLEQFKTIATTFKLKVD